MKRVLNLSLLACFFMVNIAAKASDVISVKIENSSTLNVSLSKISKGQKLYLKNYSGKVLFNIALESASSYQKYFDFNYVQDGIYFVETESEFEIKITPILKTSKGIALIEQSEVTIFKPDVRITDKMVKVMFTKVEETALQVSLQDDNGVQLFEEKFEETRQAVFKRTYNFSKVPAGTYFFNFTVGDRKFVKEINI